MAARKVIALHGQREPNSGEETTLDERSDDDCMLLARAGKAEAFDTLVLRHQRYVLCLASKYLADSGIARDVAQSSFVELYRYLPRYSAQGRFRQLLSRIVLNQCRMAGRASSTRRASLDAYAREGQLGADLPDARIIARERQRAVDRALAKLSDKQKSIIVLRFSGDLSYQEISETLGIPMGTVKSRLAAGVDKMRQVLEVDL